jgi:hypothetical protein
MTQGEVMTLTVEIRKRWPHGDMPSDDQYHHDLQAFGAHQVYAVVEAMDRDGNKFAPRGSEIIKRLAEIAVDAPDWYAVLSELRDRQAGGGLRAVLADRICPANQCNGSGITELDAAGNVIFTEEIGGKPDSSRPCICREQLVREVAQQRSAHPVVAMFLTHLDQREIADVLAGDRTAEAQTRTKYEDYVTNLHRSLAYSGIDPAGLPALERLQQERAQHAEIDAGRSQGLRKIRTLGSGDVAA